MCHPMMRSVEAMEVVTEALRERVYGLNTARCHQRRMRCLRVSGAGVVEVNGVYGEITDGDSVSDDGFIAYR